MSSWTAEIDRGAEPEWSNLLDRFHDANIYQTWAYGRVRWGDSALSHTVLRRDGEAVAAAQLRIVRTPVLGGGIAYLRWGPLWRRKDRPFEPEIALRMIQRIREEYIVRRGLALRVIPRVFVHEPEAESVRAAFGAVRIGPLPSAPPYATFLLDLRPSLEDLRKGLHKTWRKRLRQAEDGDVECVAGTGEDLFDVLTALYNDMVALKKFAAFVDPTEFREMQKHLPDAQKMTVIVCRTAGNPVSATAFAALGDTGVALVAATTPQGRERQASYLAKWRTIEHLKQRGISRLDLGGRDPARTPEVDQFKAGTGAAEATHVGTYQSAGRSPGSHAALLADRVRESYRRLRVLAE